MLAALYCSPVTSPSLHAHRQSDHIMTNSTTLGDESGSSSPNHSGGNDCTSPPIISPNANVHQFPPRRSSLSPIVNHQTPSADFFSTISAQKNSAKLVTDRIKESDNQNGKEFSAEDVIGDKWGLGLRHLDIMKEQVESSETSLSDKDKSNANVAQNPAITIDFDSEDLKLDIHDLSRDRTHDKQFVPASPDASYSPTVGSDSTLVASPKASIDSALSRPKSSQGIFSSRIRRRSWMPGSRSPSPKKIESRRELQPQDEDEELDEPLTMVASRKERLNTVISNKRPTSSQRNASFSKQFAQRLRKRPSGVSTLDTVPDASPTKSSESLFSRLQKSASEDRLSIPALIPSTRSSDRLSSYVQSDVLTFPLTSKSRQARKRDELWSTFRDLDGACQR